MPQEQTAPSGIPSGEHFFCAPNWVIDAELTPYERLLATYLYRRYGKTIRPFPARTTIAKDIDISVRTVDRAIKGLKAKVVKIDGQIYHMLKVKHRYHNRKRTSSEYTLPPLIKPVIYDDKKPLLPHGQLQNTVTDSQAGTKAPDRQLPVTASGAQEVHKKEKTEVQEEEVQQQEDVVVLLRKFKINKEKTLALVFCSSEDKIRRHVSFFRKAVKAAQDHHKDITSGKLIDAIEKDYNTQYWLRFIAALAGKKHKGDPLYDLPDGERELALDLREKLGIDVGVTINMLDAWSIDTMRSALDKKPKNYAELTEILKGDN